MLSNDVEGVFDEVNYLKKQRYKVTLFSSFHTMESSLLYSQPSLIFVDDIFSHGEQMAMNMVSIIRSQFSSNDLPILIRCSVDSVSLAVRLMKYGVNDFVTRLATRDEILVRVGNDISQSESFERIK